MQEPGSGNRLSLQRVVHMLQQHTCVLKTFPVICAGPRRLTSCVAILPEVASVVGSDIIHCHTLDAHHLPVTQQQLSALVVIACLTALTVAVGSRRQAGAVAVCMYT